MLLLTSPELVMASIFTGFKANNILIPSSESDFRESYQTYLQNLQPRCIWLRDAQHSLSDDLNKGPSENFRQQLSNLFNGDATELDDLDQTSIIKKRDQHFAKQTNVIVDALVRMESLAPDHRKFLELCIEKIFIEGSDDASGGSTSDAVGLIWANPHPRFEVNDLIEFMVHELTHNLLFLDEWVNQHYDYDAILNEKTWCQSAILKRKRPLDKVVHSLVVASELVLLRQVCLGEPTAPKAHPPTSDIVKAIMTSIKDLKKLDDAKNYVYPRVWELLDVIEVKMTESQQHQAMVA